LSIEKSASAPPIDLSSIKCFSITLAPRVTATIGAVEPSVWSEKPLITPKVSARFGIVFKFASSRGAG
jgi:hypothetical protein